MTNITTRKPSVKLVGGKATTTSLKIAESFGKRHNDVLRAIDKLECSPEFRERNFAQTVAMRENPSGGAPIQSRSFTITRDGFSFLCMGFTGKEAAQWKEKYIAAFNELERRALEKATSKRLPAPALPKALPAGRYHYPRNLLNQPYFSSPVTGEATLNASMIAHPTYVSPLMGLLNQLRSEGHEVTAPFDEALALRNAVIKTEQVLDEISTMAIRAQYKGCEGKSHV